MKTKALISFAVTAKLICAFVFAQAKIQFSHEAAHLVMVHFDLSICEMLAFCSVRLKHGTFLW